MTPEQFVYWLQGFMEVGNPLVLSTKQVQIIKDHLELVFQKETPNRNLEDVNPTIIPVYPPLPWESDYYNPYVVTCTDDPHQKLC